MVDQLPAMPSSIKQYLHLAVRLFIASSGGYDLLTRNWDAPSLQSSEPETAEFLNFEAAKPKLVVPQERWKSLGLQNSGEYLQHLFEDDGIPIEGRQIDNSEPAIPGLQSPQSETSSARSYSPEPEPSPEQQPAHRRPVYRVPRIIHDSNLDNIDLLISQATDEGEIKELKRQKRVLRNRHAAYASFVTPILLYNPLIPDSLESRQRRRERTKRIEQKKSY